MFCIGRRRREITTLPKITSAFLNLTNACNLACRYCFVEQKPDYITLQTAKDAADFLARNAEETKDIPSINFFGGEPMLMWEEIIVPLTGYVREKYGDAFGLSMTTNGTLLSEERLQFMKEHGVGLLLSIDGDRETQDYNRPLHGGGSSFDMLREKLPLLLSYYPEVTFRSTVIPKTAARLFDNATFASGLGFKSYFCIPNILEQWDKESLRSLKEELRKFSDYYISCFRAGKRLMSFSALEDCFQRIARVNEAEERRSHRSSVGCTACGKCGLGANFAAGINVDGKIYSCQEFCGAKSVREKFHIGSIYEGVLERRRHQIAKEFDDTPSRGDDCSACVLNHICDGGCVANNFFATGDVNQVPAIWCMWERLLFQEAVYILHTLGDEKNEAFKNWLTARIRHGR